MIPDDKNPKEYDDYGHRLDILSPAEKLERGHKRMIAERDGEIARLRIALQQIADYWASDDHEDYDVILSMQKIARDTLDKTVGL